MAEASEEQGGSEPSPEHGDAAAEPSALPGSEPASAEGDPSTHAEAAAPQDAATDPSAPAEGEAESGSENGDAAEAGAEAERAEGEAESGSESGDAAEAGAEAERAEGEGAQPGAKRKRKRRRKGKSLAGTEDAPSAEYAEARARRAAMAAPFLRFFVGPHAGRKHGFAVGEVVAGRVKADAGGVIAVDLFGKAMAYADEAEPREAPPEPPPPVFEPPAPPQQAQAPAPSVEVAPAPEAAATEATAAPGEVAETPSGSEAEAAPAAALDAASTTSTEIDAEHAAAAEAAALDAASEEEEEQERGQEQGHDPDHDHDHDQSGEGPREKRGRGPLPAAPIVPDDFPRPAPVQLGQVFRGRVAAIAESGHIAIVNRIVDRDALRADAERYRTERRRVLGLVFGFNRGGFDVLVAGVRAFCPASAMSLEEIPDPTLLLGQKLEFLLPTSQNTARDLIVSRRSILERQYRKQARELFRSLQPGQRMKGRVTAVRDFGLFVDIGGIEGLVHQSELSFAHGVRPGDVAKPGDEVEVQVLRVGGDPNRTAEGVRRDRIDRVSLSMKALQPDPWDEHQDVLSEGAVVTGKITSTTDFGAFIELVPSVDGLLHITELGRDLKHADQVVKVGDEMTVVVERIDRRGRRISLSKLTPDEAAEIQAMREAGQEMQSVRPGARVKVKVARVEPRGLLVRVSGVVGRRGRGYVPATELANRSGDLRKQFGIGTEIEVKIIGLDRDGGLRCSSKALQVDDERRAVKDYRREAARQGFGTFGDLLRAKLGNQPESK